MRPQEVRSHEARCLGLPFDAQAAHEAREREKASRDKNQRKGESPKCLDLACETFCSGEGVGSLARCLRLGEGVGSLARCFLLGEGVGSLARC